MTVILMINVGNEKFWVVVCHAIYQFVCGDMLRRPFQTRANKNKL